MWLLYCILWYFMFVMSWPVPTWFNCPIDWSPISTCSFRLRMEDESVLQRLLALGYHSFKIVRQSPHSGMTLGRKDSRSHQIILGCYTCKFGRNLISVWLDCLRGAALGQHSIWHVPWFIPMVYVILHVTIEEDFGPRVWASWCLADGWKC